MNYLHKLQSLNNEAKKVWLVFFTIGATLIVTIFWLFYLNSSILAVNEVPQPGTWQVFKAGLGVVGEKMEFGLANSYLYFMQGRQIKISN